MTEEKVVHGAWQIAQRVAGQSSEQPEAGRLLNLSEPQFPDLKGEVPTLAFVSN